jgi:hypothetical protein
MRESPVRPPKIVVLRAVEARSIRCSPVASSTTSSTSVGKSLAFSGGLEISVLYTLAFRAGTPSPRKTKDLLQKT